MASLGHRAAFLPAWGYLHEYMSISLLRHLVLPSRVLETSPLFPTKCMLTGHWAGCSPGHLELMEYVMPGELPVLLVPQNDFAVLPKTGVSHSIALLQVCPCSFLHSKERK